MNGKRSRRILSRVLILALCLLPAFAAAQGSKEGEDPYKASVFSTIQKERVALKACYDDYLKKNPGQNGEVRVVLDVKDGGGVGFCEVKENTFAQHKEQMGSCVCEKIAKWNFSKPPLGGFNIDYRFKFPQPEKTAK